MSRFIYQVDGFIKNNSIQKITLTTEKLHQKELELSAIKIEKENLEVKVGKEKGAVASAQAAVDTHFDEGNRLELEIDKLKTELTGPDAKGFQIFILRMVLKQQKESKKSV